MVKAMEDKQAARRIKHGSRLTDDPSAAAAAAAALVIQTVCLWSGCGEGAFGRGLRFYVNDPPLSLWPSLCCSRPPQELDGLQTSSHSGRSSTLTFAWFFSLTETEIKKKQKKGNKLLQEMIHFDLVFVF